MSVIIVVSEQFKVILLEKCTAYQHSSINTLPHGQGRTEWHARCIFHLFTAVLGYILIITITTGQIPLLYNMLRFQNGLLSPSPIKNALLMLTSSNYVAYAVYRNLPLSTWGEGILHIAEYVIITNLMLLYSGRHRHAVLFMVLYVFIMVVLLWPLVPGFVLVGLKILNLPIYSVQKGQRIYVCYKEKGKTKSSTKSAILLTNFCSFGRLFTSLVDTRDILMIATYILECLLSLVLTCQALRYWIKSHKNRISPAG